VHSSAAIFLSAAATTTATTTHAIPHLVLVSDIHRESSDAFDAAHLIDRFLCEATSVDLISQIS